MTTTGWIVLIVLCLVIFSSYLALWGILRSKKQGGDGMWENISQTIRQPWRKEDHNLDELSRRVKELEGRKGKKD